MASSSDLTSDTIRDLLQVDEDDDLSMSFEFEGAEEDQQVGVEGGDENIECTFNDVDSQHDSDVDFELSDNDIEGNANSDSELEDNISDANEGVADVEEAAAADFWREWQDDDVSFREFQYKASSGFKQPPNFDRNSEIEYFKLFFTDELLEEIVNESNRYAQDKINKMRPLSKKSMWWTWKDITVVEFKAFLGVIINMGMHPKPDIDDYFSNDWLENQPFFKDIFSKERFLQIFWDLHFSTPPARPLLGAISRSAKVKHVVKYLDMKFRQQS